MQMVCDIENHPGSVLYALTDDFAVSRKRDSRRAKYEMLVSLQVLKADDDDFHNCIKVSSTFNVGLEVTMLFVLALPQCCSRVSKTGEPYVDGSISEESNLDIESIRKLRKWRGHNL